MTSEAEFTVPMATDDDAENCFVNPPPPAPSAGHFCRLVVVEENNDRRASHFHRTRPIRSSLGVHFPPAIIPSVSAQFVLGSPGGVVIE